MKLTRRLVVMSWLCLVNVGAHGAELRLGAAAVPINPPPGIGLAGYYHERGNEGVLDDIQAKATVLDDGEIRAAIVVCDLISMPKWIVVEARRQVEERTGIPGANVMIAATHTHTAPVLFRESSRDETDGGGNQASKVYSQTLPKLIATAVAAAYEKRKPVRISVAKEHESQLAYNRRFWMRDGSVGWNPGKRNAQIIRPAGPIDPEVGVFFAETVTAKSAPVLTFVNYALHPDPLAAHASRRIIPVRSPDPSRSTRGRTCSRSSPTALAATSTTRMSAGRAHKAARRKPRASAPFSPPQFSRHIRVSSR